MTGERSNDQLRLTVENPFDPDAPPAQKTGFGLLGVRSRFVRVTEMPADSISTCSHLSIASFWCFRGCAMGAGERMKIRTILVDDEELSRHTLA